MEEDNHWITGLGVMTGWFTAAFVAFVVFLATLPAAEPADCSMYNCMPHSAQLIMAVVFFGVPAGVLGMATAIVFYATLGKRFRHVAARGTVSALSGILIGPLVYYCFTNVHY